jgi:hypothetical protein
MLSPDGSLFAVTLHPDFSLPTSEQVHDSAVLVFDSATLDLVADFPGSQTQGPVDVFWSQDGDELLVRLLFEGEWERISFPAGERTVDEGLISPIAEARRSPLRELRVCQATGAMLETVGQEGIDLLQPDKMPRRIVRVTDFPPGPFDAIEEMSFTRSCEHVFFVFDDRVWVVELSSGRIGMVADGYRAFEAP